MNRRVMAVTAAAVMSMSGFAVPAMAECSYNVNRSIDWRRWN